MSQQELLRQAREREAREGSSYSSSRFERSVDSMQSRSSSGRSPESGEGFLLGSALQRSPNASETLLRYSPPQSRVSPPDPVASPTESRASPPPQVVPPIKRSKSPSAVSTPTGSPVPSKKSKKSRKTEAAASSGSDEVDRSGSDVEKSKGKRKRASVKLKSSVDVDLAGSREDNQSETGTVSSVGSSSTKRSKKKDRSNSGLAASAASASGNSPKSPRVRKHRGDSNPVDAISSIPLSTLNYSAPAIPSPHKSRAIIHAEQDEEQFSGEGSPEPRPIGAHLLQVVPSPRYAFNDPTSQIDGSHNEDDDDLSEAFKETEYSSQMMAYQMLQNSGLAIASYGPQMGTSASASAAAAFGLTLDLSTGYTRPGKDLSSQMSAISPGRGPASPDRVSGWRADSAASLPVPNSARGKTMRVRSTRRQIVMLDNEAPPKAGSNAPINAAKISHLTIDHLFHLIATTQLSQDKSFLDTLILTHDYFISSSDLLAVIVQLYHTILPSQLTSSSGGGSTLSLKIGRTVSEVPSFVPPLTGVSPLASSGLKGPKSPRTPPDSPKSPAYDGTESRDDGREPSSPISSRPVSPVLEGSESGATTPNSQTTPAPRIKTRTRSASDVSRMDVIVSRDRESNSSPQTSEDMDVALKRLRVINVLKKLIEMRFYTLRSSRSFTSLLQRFVLELFSSSDDSEHRYGEVLRTAMKTNAAFVREDAETAANVAPAPVLQDKSSAQHITSIRYKSASTRKSLDDYSAVEIARQITLIDFANWVQVPLSELMHAAFNAKDAATSCPRLTTCTARFNELGQWVSSTVVLAAKKKHRVAVLTKFIQVMEELRRLQNFHTLMAFYSALNQPAILRLRKTWKNLSSRVTLIWNGITKFLDNSQDFKTYREYVKSADPPCIPYIGFILGGLTFTEEFPTFIVEETFEERVERRKKRASARTSNRREVGRSASAIEPSTSTVETAKSPSSGDNLVVPPSPSSSRRETPDRDRSSPARSTKSGKAPSSARSSSRQPSTTPANASASYGDGPISSSSSLGEIGEETEGVGRPSDSIGADSEPEDIMPMPRKGRHLELDDNSAASSGAEFTEYSDFPSSPRGGRNTRAKYSRYLDSSDSTSSTPANSARLPVSARGQSYASFSGSSEQRVTSASKRAAYAHSRRSSSHSLSGESALSEVESDFLNNSDEDDSTKLRRVLNEPIPHTVVVSPTEPSKLRHSVAIGSSPTSGSAFSTATQTSASPGGQSSSSSTNGASASPPASMTTRERPQSSSTSKAERATLRRAARAAAAAAAAAQLPDAGDVAEVTVSIPPGQQMLNWRKMVMLAKSFADVLRFQRTRYDLVVVKEIEKFVQDLRQHSWFLEAEELASMSQEIEADAPESSGSVRDTLSAVKETLSSVVRPSDSPSDKRGKDKKDKKDKNKARPTFTDLTHDQILFSEFRKFLIAQYSHENLLFWEAVNKFKQVDLSQPQAKIKAMANEIYGKFITGTLDEGAFTIGFGHDIKDYVAKKIAANDYEPGMFDTALQEVEHSLLKPSFGQFLNETQK